MPGGPSISWSNRARLDGAKAQAAKHNIDLEVFGPYLANYDAGRQAADTVLATNATAILAYDDLMAVGVLSRPSERGVHVPADISVVGFDNVLTHRIVSPALTTVDGRCAIAGRILVVSTAADANAVPVAEFTLAAVLFAGKRVPLLAARYRQQPGEWSWRGRVPHVSNYHRTVGVVGFSRVGQRVVEQLRPFDTTVLVADPLADPAAVASTGVVLISLDELLTRSDTVTLHAPALPETYEMIDAQRLALMRDHSTLINTARGTLVDTNALIEECRHGRIDAILDVTDPEPLPADSPLYDLLPEELAVIVVLHRTPGVRLHLADNTVPGVLALTHDPDDRSPVGQLPSGSQQVLAWQSRPLHHRAPALRLSPDTDALAPARVLDGYQRPYGSGPHMWCSDPTDIQPWLRLDWPQPITVRRVEVIVDDDVHEDLINLHHHRTPGRERPTLVRDYVIETADPDGGWTELPVETGNRRRHRVHELIDARTTTAVRLRVRAINGAPSVHVISVRVYG